MIGLICHIHLYQNIAGEESPSAGNLFAPPQLHDQAFHAAGVAFTDAFNDILLIGALILFSGALAVFALVRQSDFVPHAPPAQAEVPQEPAAA